MDTSDLFHWFDAEHEAFLAACERAGASAQVPSCPGWTVADLLYHMYEVQYGWHRVTAERREGFEGLAWPARPADDRLVDLVRGEHAGYAAMLRSFEPSTPIWTWAGQESFGWLVRRMAQEVAVHRVDADLASGVAASLDAALASDGIDEFLAYFLNVANGPVGGSVHIHCTDVAGEWTIRETGSTDGEPFDVTREHAKGDAAIRGAAHDILLALWRRGPLTACDVVGDADVAARFVAASRLE
ncbi:MAG: maleylpyruvate isomerase family mycothiol-dependent enzyme [Ilumatobacteraceae bacterium]